MPRPPRRLPVLVERSVQEVNTLRTDLSAKFEMQVRNHVAEQGKTITCRAGCAWCCYHPVMISVLEAVPIYRYLQRKGRWTEALKTKLKDTSDKQYGASFETWLFAMIPCPLLDGKNHCMGYEVRPLICRTYYATSNPDYCHPHKLGDGTEIVGRSEVVEKYHERQEQVLRHHRLRFSALPIGKALLLAERVCTGRMDLESVDSEVLAEYVEKA